MDKVNLRGRWRRELGGGLGSEGRPGEGGAGGSAGEGRRAAEGLLWGERGSGGDGTLTERTGLPAAGGVAGRDELSWGPLGSLLQGLQKERNQKVQTVLFREARCSEQAGSPETHQERTPVSEPNEELDHMQSAGRPRP